MKKILFAILASVTLMTSCYDLDRAPYDAVSEATFWKTEGQLKEGMMGVYSLMKPVKKISNPAASPLQPGAFGWAFTSDALTDIAQGHSHYGYFSAIMNTATDRWYVYDEKWQSTFDGVHKANTVLSKIGGIAGLEESAKSSYEGEAKFMRALYYFELMNFFGQVPLYDETLKLYDSNAGIDGALRELNIPRNTTDEVFAFIIKDLTAAINSELPVKWAAAEYGRATKGAAYALRGKVYLYQKEYALAKADFEEIILDASSKGYGYSLHANYAELFTPVADQSDEMIFAIQNSTAPGQQYGMPMAFFMGTRATNGSCWNNVAPSRELVESYECIDGKPFDWEDFFPGFTTDIAVKEKVFKSKMSEKLDIVLAYPEYRDDLLAMYDNRDPRMKQTILLPYTTILGWAKNAPKVCEYVSDINGKGLSENNGFIRIQGASFATSYLSRKFVPEGSMDGQLTKDSDREHTPINFPLIRLADIYLLYAECMNELNDITVAVEYINKVRQRASTNMPDINSGPAWLVAASKSDVLDRIKHERVVELALEGHRWNDTRRWGIALEVLPAISRGFMDDIIYKRPKDARNLLWPVPGVEMERLPALKPNNPGW